MRTASVRPPRSKSAHSHCPISLGDLAQALDYSDEGFALTDPEGNYVYLNDAHLRIYGYEKPQELLGRSWRTLYDSEWIRHLEHTILPILQRDKVWRGRVIGRRRDRSAFPAGVTLTLLPDGKITCNCRDESSGNADAAALLDERQAAMHVLGEHVISGLPARLRKPLDMLAGYTGFFLSELSAGREVPADTLREGLAEIEAAGRRLAAQMQRLDMLGRLAEADRPSAGETGEWPGRLTAAARHLAQSVGRAADLGLDITPAPLAMDYCPVEFVVLELLGNAFQCSRPGDAVQITGRAMGSAYEMKVCDDGIGLPPGGIQPASGRTVGQETAAGFGLAVVSCILERMGGRMEIKRGDTCSTCCRLILPLRGK